MSQRNLDSNISINSDEANKFVGIDGNMKIFWGPGQLIGYTTSDSQQWRESEVLNIPQVTRLIWNTQDSYDTDGYSDKGTPPPPPPPPPLPTVRFEYEIANPSAQYRRKAEYFGWFGETDTGTFFDFGITVGADKSGVSWYDPAGQLKFQGTFESLANSVYFEPFVSNRTIRWYVWAPNFSGVMSKSLVTSVNGTFAPFNAGYATIPPRCSYIIDYGDGYIGPPVTSEVPNYSVPGYSANLRTNYGC